MAAFDKPDEIGRRVAELYQELSFPAAAKLQSALRKEGISLSLSALKELTSETGARQVFQPPPRYGGHITSGRMDDRWAADLLSFESKPAKRADATYTQVLIVQDIFSRYLWAEPISRKTQVRRAFEDILDKSGRTPRELNSDKGTEFTSREFQTMLARRNIQFREKVGKNDIATVDRAMGTLKDMLARRGADAGGDWLAELPNAVAAYNKLDHSALHDNAPAEVEDDKDLRFQLRHENAEKRLENAQQAQERKRKLEATGAFRTLLQPTAFKRRAGVPNWSKEVHTVAEATPAQVTDTKGDKFDTRLVLPVSSASSAVQDAPRGTAPRDAQRRTATQRFVPELMQIVLRAGSDGMTLALAGRTMAAKEGFTRTLREQRMTFRQFVDLNADTFRLQIRGNASKILVTPEAAAQTRQRPDGTLMQFQRLRPLRDAPR
jgi:transposase InsO family protein